MRGCEWLRLSCLVWCNRHHLPDMESVLFLDVVAGVVEIRRGGPVAIIFSALLLLSLSAWFFALAVISYRTGEGFSKWGTFQRRDSPVWFWIYLVIEAGMGTGLLVYAGWLLVTRLIL